jgi:hypothetical protein
MTNPNDFDRQAIFKDVVNNTIIPDANTVGILGTDQFSHTYW